MPASLTVGIAGFGAAGRNMHYRAIRERLGDIARVGAVLTRRPLGEPSPDDFPLDADVTHYRDLASFLAHPGLDVVHVTTPSGAHAPVVLAAAVTGKHVICDKPLEVTLAAADACIDACRRAGTALSVCFQRRYHPSMQRLKALTEEGFFGEIARAEVSVRLYRDPAYYEGNWHGTRALDGGGALMNQGIHYLDLALWLVGSPVVEVRDAAAERILHTGIEMEDFAAGELVHANGALTTLTAGTCLRPGFDQRLILMGTRGWAIVADGIVTAAWREGADCLAEFGRQARVAGSGSSPVLGTDNHGRYFRAVYEALRAGGPVPVPGEEARADTEAVLAVYLAAQTGVPVRLPLLQA